jgi:hypothetical protein
MEVIRGKYGEAIGYRERCGSRIYLRDEAGQTLGYYDEGMDRTYDNVGMEVGQGNILSSLLP